MRTLAFAAFFAAQFSLAPASAQEWSPEQQEVWEFELSCQESKEVWTACFHEDYEGWGDLTFGVPVSKPDVAIVGGYFWDSTDVLMQHIKPVSIRVLGDFAIVLSIYTATNRSRETGEVVTTSQAWTDICIKENGRWYWIADHGTVVDGG